MAGTIDQILSTAAEAAVERAVSKRSATLAGESQGEMLSPTEACDALSVSVSTIHRWLDAGLPALRRGRVIRIRRSDLEAWLSSEERSTLRTTISRRTPTEIQSERTLAEGSPRAWRRRSGR